MFWCYYYCRQFVNGNDNYLFVPSSRKTFKTYKSHRNNISVRNRLDTIKKMELKPTLRHLSRVTGSIKRPFFGILYIILCVTVSILAGPLSNNAHMQTGKCRDAEMRPQRVLELLIRGLLLESGGTGTAMP